MKILLSLIISGALVVSGFGQTRNVLVGTNNSVVQPTNFWSADATNARSGLGLGSAATNPASAFQPSSTVLSNLASSNGANLTNIPLAGVVGALATNGNGFGLTNINASNITGIIPASNIPTVSLTNISGTLAVSSGGTGATNAGGARTNLGLGATNDVEFQGVIVGSDLRISNGTIFWGTNERYTPEDNVFLTAITVEGSIAFNNTTNAATTRTNLGLGWSALTNTNAGTGLVSVNTNGEVVSPTNFWQVAPIQTLVQDFTVVVTTQTNNATNARNLYIYSLATNVTGISNTILLPTNAATFAGDEVTVIHQGTTNTTTVVRQAGSTNNLITLSRFDEAVKFIRESGQWDFYHNISHVEPIQFSGTNATANAAASRTNLGLGATWLTNTNVTNFRTAIGLGVSNSVIFNDLILEELSIGADGILFQNEDGKVNTRANLGIPLAALTNTNNANFQAAVFNTNTTPVGSAFNTIVAWMEVHVFTNGSNTSFRVPLFK